MNELLTVEDLAELLHKSPHSVRHDATRNPSALPPICRIPKTRRLLWRRIDVEDWLAQHVTTEVPEHSGPTSGWLTNWLGGTEKKHRVGRPTKAEQIAKRGENP